jgi:hypothetical protein
VIFLPRLYGNAKALTAMTLAEVRTAQHMEKERLGGMV